MVSFGLILIFSALAASPSVLAKPRIIGGQQAAQGQFPWQVEFQITRSRNGFSSETAVCTGVLISAQWILTSAHCIHSANQIRIVAGAVDSSDPDAVSASSAEAILHENYDPSVLRPDIGVVRLQSPLNLNDRIKTIALANSDPPGGSQVVVSGWGETTPESGSYSQVLMYTTVDIIQNSECEQHFGSDNVPSSVICAMGNSKGACFGDGGTPLIYNFNQDPSVVGIFSFLSVEGCEGNYPMGCTRISSYRDWIRNKTGI